MLMGFLGLPPKPRPKARLDGIPGDFSIALEIIEYIAFFVKSDGGGGNRTRVRRHLHRGYYMFITGFRFVYQLFLCGHFGKLSQVKVRGSLPENRRTTSPYCVA